MKADNQLQCMRQTSSIKNKVEKIILLLFDFKQSAIRASSTVNAIILSSSFAALRGFTLTYMQFPHAHWLKIRSNNLIELINREIRRRTDAAGSFPDGNSALMLVCARLRYVSSSECGVKTYLSMERLFELERDREASAQEGAVG